MPLAATNKLLKEAHNKKYAIGGFNVFNFETISAIIEVAEELKTPVIIGLPERLFKFVDVELLAHSMVKAAEKACVPVAVHLDHGQTYEGVMKAVRWGFTSIMYDGSKLPYGENLAQTKNIVKMAHAIGIAVEGQMGHGNEYTLEKIIEFVERTKVDSISMDIDLPGVNLEFLRKIEEALGIPMVMHGGKRDRHNPQYYRPYIDAGVNKVNVATDMSNVASRTLKVQLPQNENANYITLMNDVKKAVKESVTKYMLAFDCISKI